MDWSKLMLDPTKPLPWEKDGKKGPADINNSENLIITWLSAGDNYAAFRGKNNNGRSKAQCYSTLEDLLKEKQVKVPQTKKDIKNKVEGLESSFRAAMDYINGNGKEDLVKKARKCSMAW
jgi:hypothetical protein